MADTLLPGDIVALARRVVEENAAAGRTVAVAESCTGGLVAAAFDELLGLVQMHAGQPGMTARLVINYRSPTPLHEELRLEGRVVRVEGRKTFCTGEIHAGDRLCAEAEALFVALDPGRFAEMVERLDR